MNAPKIIILISMYYGTKKISHEIRKLKSIKIHFWFPLLLFLKHTHISFFLSVIFLELAVVAVVPNLYCYEKFEKCLRPIYNTQVYKVFCIIIYRMATVQLLYKVYAGIWSLCNKIYLMETVQLLYKVYSRTRRL